MKKIVLWLSSKCHVPGQHRHRVKNITGKHKLLTEPERDSRSALAHWPEAVVHVAVLGRCRLVAADIVGIFVLLLVVGGQGPVGGVVGHGRAGVATTRDILTPGKTPPPPPPPPWDVGIAAFLQIMQSKQFNILRFLIGLYSFLSLFSICNSSSFHDSERFLQSFLPLSDKVYGTRRFIGSGFRNNQRLAAADHSNC